MSCISATPQPFRHRRSQQKRVKPPSPVVSQMALPLRFLRFQFAGNVSIRSRDSGPRLMLLGGGTSRVLLPHLNHGGVYRVEVLLSGGWFFRGANNAKASRNLARPCFCFLGEWVINRQIFGAVMESLIKHWNDLVTSVNHVTNIYLINIS